MVKHVFKDGTTTEELKDVYIPNDIMKNIYQMAVSGEGKDEKQNIKSNINN